MGWIMILFVGLGTYIGINRVLAHRRARKNRYVTIRIAAPENHTAMEQ